MPAVRAKETGNADIVFGTSLSSNPHQEFLLWGVELGFIGPMLLIGLLWASCLWAKTFPVDIFRSTVSVVLTITVACLFNSALYDDLLGDFLCFALGIVLAFGNTADKHSNTAKE